MRLIRKILGNKNTRPAYLKLIFFSLIFSLSLPSSSIARTSSFIAEVVAVLSGDTIKVLKSRRVMTVRLQGIDSPGKTQRYATQAKDFTERIAFGQKVVVNIIEINQKEDILARVILEDGRSLSREIVKAGFAWWYRDYSEDLSLWRLENQAREKKLGLWLGRDPVPPWEFDRTMRDN